MKAAVGDRIVTASGVVGGAVRDGVVVELKHADGSPPYVVQWEDTGERSLVFPGPDSYVDRGQEPADRRAAVWQVQVALVETSGSTTAEAVLVAGAPEPLRAVGHARKDPGDEEVPVIGDEIAAGRALRRLADRLLAGAEADIEASTGDPAHVHP